MKKTVYIPRGEECGYENLTCENLVVNGVLDVSDSITAKRISGSGVIRANYIKTDSLVCHDITAGYIVTDELAAKRVSAVSITAVQSITVSSYLEAGYVDTCKATIAKAEVENMRAHEIVKLPSREHSLYGVVLLSAIRSLWVELVYLLKQLSEGPTDKNKSQSTEKSNMSGASDVVEHSEPAEDDAGFTSGSDFIEFVEMYRNYRAGIDPFGSSAPREAGQDSPFNTVVPGDLNAA